MTECYLPCHDKIQPSNSSKALPDDWWPSAKVNASLRNPPYKIHNGGDARNPLGTKTMPVTASNLDGTLQYDTHNVYGLAEAKATQAALMAIKQTRPFILTRCAPILCFEKTKRRKKQRKRSLFPNSFEFSKKCKSTCG